MTGGTGSSSTSRLHVQGLRSALAGPFNLDLAAGECVAITGASGSGKSLFLRMVADMDPNDGTLALDGRARATFTPPAWRRQVVYVQPEPGWWDEQVAPHFTDLPIARALAPRLGLDPALFDGAVLRLSTGERQRLALIRSLALRSPVLLLDEATGALDEASTAMVEALLRERLAAGASILMVTHNPEQAVRLGHRHLEMAARRLVPAQPMHG